MLYLTCIPWLHIIFINFPNIDDMLGEITIFIMAHRLSTIKNADYIYLIDEGKILESGTWKELLKK